MVKYKNQTPQKAPAGRYFGYYSFLDELKGLIKKEKLAVILNANQRMILMYWYIGKAILAKQEAEGWGAKIVDRLSVDLKNAFPEETGFSPRNLKYMRKFAEAWPELEIVQPPLHKFRGEAILPCWIAYYGDTDPFGDIGP